MGLRGRLAASLALLFLVACEPSIQQRREKGKAILGPIVRCTKWREFRYSYVSGYVTGPGLQYECVEWEDTP